MSKTPNPETPPELLTLADELATVVVAPEIGGAIASYTWNGPRGRIDWFRPTSDTAVLARDAVEFGCFPLVPYSNRIRDSRFSFGGRDIDLGGREGDPHTEHGYGWRSAWEVLTRDDRSVTLRYLHQSGAWPWRFSVEQRMALDRGALSIRLELRNLDGTAMPAGMGVHPFFPADPDTRLDAMVGGMWETDAEVMPTRHGPVPTETDPNAGLMVSANELDTVFTGWSGRATISWPSKGARLDMAADTLLGKLVVYTPRGAGYFCAEPVSNDTNAFNLASGEVADTGLFVLQPGEVRAAEVTFAPSLLS